MRELTMEEIVAQGEATAEKMALRVQKAYATFVEENWKEYILVGQEPDEEDFFAWVEMYGWGEEE